MWAVAPQLVRAAPHLLRAGAAIVGLAAAGTAIEGIDLIGRGGIAGHRWQTYQWEPEQPPPSPPPKRPKPEGSLVKEFISAAGWILYFDKVFSSERPPKLIVVYFWASWSDDCLAMDPVIEDMAFKFPDVHFNKIDITEAPGVAKQYKINTQPTFVLIKQKVEIARVTGPKKDELQNKISMHRA